MQTTTFYRIAWVALALTFVVVILGAYVRLSDAGLGCPDWPGCYGKLLDIPDQVDQIAAANSAYPHRPVEPAKAWKEMIHRYCAGTLGLLILALAVLAWRDRRQAEQPIALPLAPVSYTHLDVYKRQDVHTVTLSYTFFKLDGAGG